jgi:beta-galactosidase/beta-glucuronidase
LTAGDWSRIDGLSSYSGGGWYRRTLRLTSEQARRPAQLDLGSVSASAEVRVNGKSAGVRMAPPFRVDLTGLLLPGDNRIEVLVYSALSNHYQTIPTRYLAPSPSGLLGPVTLRFEDSER